MKSENLSIKISVIIPVWNPGPGIARCIDSLRNQTLQEIEMIFIDDRGMDGSIDKVRAAAKDDPRIRIIKNQKNTGAGMEVILSSANSQKMAMPTVQR